MNQFTPHARIFLVGCPRSGTTLLQSLLASHPEITSFPESHFFYHLLEHRGTLRRRLRLASAQTRRKLEGFIDEIDEQNLKKLIPKYALFEFQWIQAFTKILDRRTQQRNRTIWLEKTPENVRYIDTIEQNISGVKFIHIIRNATDVIASLYDVSRQHPDVWIGAWSIDKCIRVWIEDVKFSQQNIHKPNHIIVSYEELVDHPHGVLARLCEFIGVQFTETMLKDYTHVSQALILKNEPWKASVAHPIQNANGKKFDQIFSSEQKSSILNRLLEYQLDNKRQTDGVDDTPIVNT